VPPRRTRKKWWGAGDGNSRQESANDPGFAELVSTIRVESADVI
jgi:hypothetical protein